MHMSMEFFSLYYITRITTNTTRMIRSSPIGELPSSTLLFSYNFIFLNNILEDILDEFKRTCGRTHKFQSRDKNLESKHEIPSLISIY